MRQKLKEGLIREGSTRNWEHITEQIGMFCFTGMKPDQVKYILPELNPKGALAIPPKKTKPTITFYKDV